MGVLSHYSRSDVQEEILRVSKNREIWVKYGERNGKRPDIIQYQNDIQAMASQNASSFHMSLERWEFPMMLNPALSLDELNELRVGWDLLFDIDIPNIEISKLTGYLIIKALKDHGIKSISIKFSGNKGFHIGVPFEAFPSKIKTNFNKEKEKYEKKEFFPKGLLKISEYLMDYIDDKYLTTDGSVVQFDKYKITVEKLHELFPEEQIIVFQCDKCNNIFKEENHGKIIYYTCHSCSDVITVPYNERDSTMECSKCKKRMDEEIQYKRDTCNHKMKKKFNRSLILEVDKQLFSSRHLFRMPYSMHEKAGLVSIPFNPDKIMKFDKKYAKIDVFKISKHKFLSSKYSKEDEGKSLVEKAIDHNHKDKPMIIDEKEINYDEKKNFSNFSEKIPTTLFPPCIQAGLNGVKDGKKRFLFALINFLDCGNYLYDEIKEFLLEWNKNNDKPLRENIILGQLNYNKTRKGNVMPPNCFYEDSSSGYYQDIGICNPDSFCSKVKNPFQYSKRKTRMLVKNKKPDSKKPLSKSKDS